MSFEGESFQASGFETQAINGFEAEQPLTVYFETLDLYTNLLKDWSITSDYLMSTDGFSFTLYDPRLTEEFRLEMQAVELTLLGAQQLLGRIDVTEIGAVVGAVVCRGRDYLSDLVECNVDPAMVIKASMTLEDVVKTTSCTCGITDVLGSDDVLLRNVRSGAKTRSGSPKDFRSLKLEDLKVDPGTGQYETLNRIVARHGATMQPGAKRSEIVLEAPNYDQEPLYAIRRSMDNAKGASNNVIEGVATSDYSSFPTHTLFRTKTGGGEKGLTSTECALDIADIVDSIGGDLAEVVQNSTVAGRRLPNTSKSKALAGGMLYRLLYQQDSDSRTKEQLERVARRALGERLKDTLVYRATLRGSSDPFASAIWSTNTIVDVKDEVAKVNEPLWIASREISYQPGQGVTTKIVAWRPGAFVV